MLDLFEDSMLTDLWKGFLEDRDAMYIFGREKDQGKASINSKRSFTNDAETSNSCSY
jgi:hypothetical protein